MFVQMCVCLSYFSKSLCMFKFMNKDCPGLKNPEIMEIGGVGFPNNKTESLLDPN